MILKNFNNKSTNMNKNINTNTNSILTKNNFSYQNIKSPLRPQDNTNNNNLIVQDIKNKQKSIFSIVDMSNLLISKQEKEKSAKNNSKITSQKTFLLSKQEKNRLQQLKTKYSKKNKENQNICEKQQKQKINDLPLIQKFSKTQKYAKIQTLDNIQVLQNRLRDMMQSLRQKKQSSPLKYIQKDMNQNKILIKTEQIQVTKQIDQFKEKVFKVNFNIQSQLDYLEEKLNILKNKRKNQILQEKIWQNSPLKKSQISDFDCQISKFYDEKFNSKQSDFKYNDEVIQQKEGFIHKAIRKSDKKNKPIQSPKILVQSEIIQLTIKSPLSSTKINQPQSQRKKFIKDHLQQKKEIKTQQSSSQIFKQKQEQVKLQIDFVQLKGKFKKKVPKEFTTFINRLSYQIKLDTEFTQSLVNILSISIFQGKQTKNLLLLIKQKVKSMTNHYPIEFQDDILQVNQMELDPLHTSKSQIQNLSRQQILSISVKIRDQYVIAQQFYYKKLHKRFNLQVIQFLVQQLKEIHQIPQNGINIGHLTSYINMRTDSQYRNRNLFKILKRMKIQGNILKTDKLKQNLSIQNKNNLRIRR